jgi:dienelactone hydrolase
MRYTTIMRTSYALGVSVLLTTTMACSNEQPQNETKDPIANSPDSIHVQVDTMKKNTVLPEDTIIFIADRNEQVQFDIRYPDQVSKGTILVLHGWNLPHLEWCEKTSFCSEALAEGYALIIPNMGRSTYSWELYPETIERYIKYPTRQWLVETAFVHLKEQFQLLKTGDNNFVIGLSTGARGATLLALEQPTVFKAAASLSGDFDLAKLPTDEIYIGFYGTYDQFKERWDGKDNIYNRVNEFETPIYLGHGDVDNVCNVKHTEEFYHHLIENKPDLKVEFNKVTGAKHDYTYWGSETKPMLAFFDAVLNSK